MADTVVTAPRTFNDVSEALQRITLDPDLYSLNDAETAFFKKETGIQDDNELKEHIISVQAEAWKVFPYRCIRGFAFTKLKISWLPAYIDLLNLSKERKDAVFLDLGCCFGNDVRKAVADGYPVQNAIASDLHAEFWDLGHKLFKSTPETFPVPFIGGDIFDPNHIKPREPFYEVPETPRPALAGLTSLNPLQGHISAIHTSSFFHLFDEEKQLAAARALGSLLSPEPGSMIFGEHGSQPVRGMRSIPNSRGERVFCHPPDSWKELWDGVIFKKGTVSVEAELHERFRPQIAKIIGAPPDAKFYLMTWSVKRL